jgi:hypothetical protein
VSIRRNTICTNNWVVVRELWNDKGRTWKLLSKPMAKADAEQQIAYYKGFSYNPSKYGWFVIEIPGHI